MYIYHVLLIVSGNKESLKYLTSLYSNTKIVYLRIGLETIKLLCKDQICSQGIILPRKYSFKSYHINI